MSSVEGALVRRLEGREWGRGPLRLRLYPADHPTADVEIAAAIVAAVAVLALALLPLGALSGVLPPCRFHAWTGWPCATCGIGRGVVALGNGNPLQALRLNPLFIGGLLLFLVYSAIAVPLWLLRLPRPRIAVATRAARVALVLAALGAVLTNWAFLIADGR